MIKSQQETALIVRSNYLIEASYRLTVQEQRIILLMASMIQPDDEDFKLYRINIRDFMELAGVAGHSKYEDIRQITKKLRERTLIFRKPGSELQVGWLSSAEYFDGKGYVELEFSPKLKPYLLKLKEFFTKYQLKNVMQLKSSYSIRVYELLKQYESIGERRLELPELREILGIKPEEYPFYANFKQKVLNPAKKELMNNSDIAFEYREVKNKRRVVALIFLIKPNKPKRKGVGGLQMEIEFPGSLAKRELYGRLQGDFCLSPAQAREIIKNHDEPYILQNLAVVEEDYKAGKVKSLAPYTLKALEEDFRPKKSRLDQEQEEAKKGQLKKEEAQKRIEELRVEFEREGGREAERIISTLPETELLKERKRFEKEELNGNKGLMGLYREKGLDSSIFQTMFRAFVLERRGPEVLRDFVSYCQDRGVKLVRDKKEGYTILP